MLGIKTNMQPSLSVLLVFVTVFFSNISLKFVTVLNTKQVEKF